MVAPHDTGDSVRSLVRIPGSGSKRAAGSKCLDLGRASSLAASVAVPTTLPPTLAAPKVKQTPISLNKKLGSQIAASAGILPAKRDDPEDHKCQRPVESSDNSEATQLTKERIYTISQANVAPGSLVLVAVQPQSSNWTTVNLSGTSLSQLIQERDNLRQENKELQRKLSLFQQLFKNKKRLTSVVKRLGVNVP